MARSGPASVDPPARNAARYMSLTVLKRLPAVSSQKYGLCHL
jgi:hypothetical protein